MKTDYEIIKAKLENFPDFRERRFRSNGLMILALRATGLENRYKEKQFIDISELADLAVKYESLNRTWRDVLSDEENKHLRGTDYYEKKTILEQEKQLQLGYVPGYASINKELSKL